MSAAARPSWNKALAGPSSVRPSHFYSSLFRLLNRGHRPCETLPQLHLSDRICPNAPCLKCPISPESFMLRGLLHLPQLQLGRSRIISLLRISLVMPPHLVLRLPVVLALLPHLVVPDLRHPPRVTDVRRPPLLRAIPCYATDRRSSTPKDTSAQNVCHLSYPALLTRSPARSPPMSYSHASDIKAAIRATRTLTRITHAASAGTASASLSRPCSLRARGVTKVVPPPRRARASAAARSSVRCPRSSPPRNASDCHRCPARIPKPLPFPCHLGQCPRQVRRSSCLATRVSVGDSAGGVGDAA